MKVVSIKKEQGNMKILIGIGCEKEQFLPTRVLQHSIQRHTEADIEFLELGSIRSESPLGGKTPFSLQRFAFADVFLASHFDVGIYFDSDMCVFGDILELVGEFFSSEVDLATCSVPKMHKRRPQSSVLIFNKQGAVALSERLRQFRLGHIKYEQLMYFERERGFACLLGIWNCLEYFDSQTRLLHFTDMDSQPWLRSDNHLGGVWIFALTSWLAESENNLNLLEREVRKGNVRPSLLEAIKPPYSSHRSIKGIMADALFIPPHRFLKIPQRLRIFLRPVLKAIINFKFFTNGRDINNRDG